MLLKLQKHPGGVNLLVDGRGYAVDNISIMHFKEDEEAGTATVKLTIEDVVVETIEDES